MSYLIIFAALCAIFILVAVSRKNKGPLSDEPLFPTRKPDLLYLENLIPGENIIVLSKGNLQDWTIQYLDDFSKDSKTTPHPKYVLFGAEGFSLEVGKKYKVSSNNGKNTLEKIGTASFIQV